MNRFSLFIHDTGFYRYWLVLLALLLITSLGFAGCNSTSATSDNDAELVVSLTDAEGDFLSYTVDVLSLKMIKQNGAEIETLPLTTTLDFAQYVEVTEFLTAATVPSGQYVGAQIVLDYSQASIKVQAENGDLLDATVIDTEGNPVTQMTVDISLNGGSEFVIVPGIPAHITLDFDLDASNAITIDGSNATVVVSPVLIADTMLEEPKPHRLRGLLGRVDVQNDQFNVAMRPFRHRLLRFGHLNVDVNDKTTYEVDGSMYAGDAGLETLAALPPASAVVVLGILNVQQRTFQALEVYAGSSVPWGQKDIVSGNVVQRSGNVITVRGATIARVDGSFIFNDDVSVQLDSDTSVVKQGDAAASYDKDDISVGQHITVSGTLTDVTTPTVNADHVRMHYTGLGGTVVSVSPLAIDLQAIDRRRIALFDFAGTGVDAANDADADYYEIDSGSLSLANLQNGDPVKVRGFARAFGQAPEDFSAQTLVDVSNVVAHLVVTYGEQGSTQAVVSLTDTGLQLSLDGAGDLHHMYRAGVATDLASLSVMPMLAPRDSGRGLFVIAKGASVRVYAAYSAFQSALAEQLDGTTAILSVHAHGVYDADENVLSARKINLRLTP